MPILHKKAYQHRVKAIAEKAAELSKNKALAEKAYNTAQRKKEYEKAERMNRDYDKIVRLDAKIKEQKDELIKLRAAEKARKEIIFQASDLVGEQTPFYQEGRLAFVKEFFKANWFSAIMAVILTVFLSNLTPLAFLAGVYIAYQEQNEEKDL